MSTYSPRRILLANLAGTGGSPSPSVKGVVVSVLPAFFLGPGSSANGPPGFALGVDSLLGKVGNFSPATVMSSGDLPSVAGPVETYRHGDYSHRDRHRSRHTH